MPRKKKSQTQDHLDSMQESAPARVSKHPKQKYIEGMAPNESVPEDVVKGIERMFKLKKYYDAYKEAEKKIKKYMNENWGSIEQAEDEVIIQTDAAKLYALQDKVTYKIHVIDRDADPVELFGNTPEEEEGETVVSEDEHLE